MADVVGSKPASPTNKIVIERPYITGIAAWAANPRLHYPDSSLYQARLSFVDTLACMGAGAREPLVRRTADAMFAAGATSSEATILGDASLSAPAAALVNGTAAHAHDFDDYEMPASTHPSAVIVPALLAIAGLRQVSIGALATAYLVGYDVIVCTGLALGGYQHYLCGWHATSTVGPIGAAAACAKIIGLPSERFAASLSLAMSTSAGLKTQFGTDAKSLHAGFAARIGVEVALLAEAGLTANPSVTDGAYGFFARYGGGSQVAQIPIFDVDAAYAMETHPVLRKPWPSCSYTHRIIEAALILARAAGFDINRVAQGTIRLPEPYYRVAPFLAPNTPARARFSVLYCVAAALYDGTLTPDSFAESAINRPAVHSVMARFAVDAYDAGPSLDDMSPSFPDTVSLRLMDGAEHSETVADVKGGVKNPLCESDIIEKFAFCGGPIDVLEFLLSGETHKLFRFSSLQWTHQK